MVINRKEEYLKNPHKCSCCGMDILPKEKESMRDVLRKKFCCRECYNNYISSKSLNEKKDFSERRIPLIDLYSKEELEQIVKQSKSYKEVIDKIGYSTHSGSNSKTVKNRIEKYCIDTSHFNSKERKKRCIENIFIENSDCTQAVLRRHYILIANSEYVCSICGQEPYWHGKELTLILDHINGNNKDDRFENLRWVCPNCNQQLETTGYKKVRTGNKQKKKYYCIDCGEEMCTNSKRCDTCSKIYIQKNIKK